MTDEHVLLDMNNPAFQDVLFALQKPERAAVLDTLKKFRQLTWPQVYDDKGLHWEKISSVKPPKGIPALYSLRVTQSCRATAFRDGDILHLLTICPDHDTAYGKK